MTLAVIDWPLLLLEELDVTVVNASTAKAR
jgi:hypothetical protein